MVPRNIRVQDADETESRDAMGALASEPQTVSQSPSQAQEIVSSLSPPPQVAPLEQPNQPQNRQTDQPELKAESSLLTGQPTSDMPLSTPPGSQVVDPSSSDSTIPATDSHTKPAKKSGKGMIVAVAVALMVVLMAIATLVFIKSNTSFTAKKNPIPTDSKTQSIAAGNPAPTPVTATEIDNTSKEVDVTLGTLDDSKDFNADPLSDKALGL